VIVHWPFGYEVMEWPEYQAMMNRMGIEFPYHFVGVTLPVNHDCVTSVTLPYTNIEPEEPKT
jgi:hypothetical protein